MKVVWSATAQHELARATAYIGSHNPAAAEKVEARLRTAVEHLLEFPRAGRIGRKIGTREVVITEYPYVIRYRVSAEHVQILRIFHTSTNWTVS